TDAYAAGEMKHGPIALLDEQTPVVCVATSSAVLPKVVQNIQEVRARGAKVIAVTSEGDDTIGPHADATIAVPATEELLAPLLSVIPLQLLAYWIAVSEGRNPDVMGLDDPRQLAARRTFGT
ncbi:MAG: SIS domain-containing protein, partial [Thermoplasmata archaeon]|nr:SIS domain-containing protein [Thermoplasmata archaeon]